MQSYSLNKNLSTLRPELKARHLNQIAAAYLSFNPEKSLHFADSALELSIATGNSEEEILANYHIGNACSQLLMYEKALSYLDQAFEKAKNSGHDTIVSNIQYVLGNTYYQMNKYSEAIGQILNSAAIEERLNRQKQLAKRYKFLGKMYHASGDYLQVNNLQ